jgi:alkanesulfonate monooxygenase SsuD/methylene tetrahydromethanopterin reductase-like flavin-dependent oxidoreductase (luciferase family)
MTFLMRFDLRAPQPGTPARDLYAAALEMAPWAEAHGFMSLVVSEHHASVDGYLPSPLVMASAFAARTNNIPIVVAALLAPLYDPIRLAEDIAVLDHVSGGRVAYVIGVGYRPCEYEAYGLDYAARGRTAESHIATLRKAWTGEPFEYEGRTVQVLPTPGAPPMLMYGGATRVAARRAARLDLPFFPQGADQAVIDEYQAERSRLGLGEGIVMAPGNGPLNVFVSEDPDQAWSRLGPHLLHDAQQYAKWQIDAGLTSAALDTSTSIDELREAGVYAIVTPDECADIARTHGMVALHPLCGGIAPDLAWESLELIASKVQPALSAPTG